MVAGTEDLVVHFSRGPLRQPFVALDRLNLEVREGDFFALLGQNGAGKSTVMHCLVGLMRPTSGRVYLFGETPEPGAAVFARVAYLPEEPRYHEYLTVEEAVTYYARLSGVRSPHRDVSHALERLGLAEHRQLALRRCSKGMKQKVGIAQCLIHAPRLMLLDEPMRGLDPMTVHLFRETLLDLNRREGVTIVMNSHLLSEVELVANRVAIIHKGRLIVQKPVAELRGLARDRYTIEVEGSGPLPPMVMDLSRTNGRARGAIASDALFEFMEFARGSGLRVISCALEQQSLEESFLSILKSEAPHA